MLVYQDYPDSNHTYFHSEKPDFKLMSVTTAVKTKKISNNESHWNYWALYKVLEARIPDFKRIKPMVTPRLTWLEQQAQRFNPTEIEQEILALRKLWADNAEKAANTGTEEHEKKELHAFESQQIRNPFTGKMVTAQKTSALETDMYGEIFKRSLFENLADLPDGLLPEQMLSYLFLAGTSDQVFIETINTKRYVDINDFKFKKKITMGNKYNKFLYPWNNFEESDINTAAFQLSFYAYFLEQAGFIPRHLAITHHKRMLPVTYLKREIELFISEFTTASEEKPEYSNEEDLI